MNISTFKKQRLALSAGLGIMTILIVPISAMALATPATSSTPNDQARLQKIITRGNSEIARRLTSLAALSMKISSASKLSASDQATLSGEVTSETGGLNSLKMTLDAETQVMSAVTDAQSIFTDYRVYYLVVPKVNLIKTADDQQVAESKLTALASKIQADITADQTAGKNVSSLLTQEMALTTKIQSAQSISTSIESSVINLQPNDYNTNHSILSGDRDQLKTAQADIVAAITDAKNLVAELKTV